MPDSLLLWLALACLVPVLFVTLCPFFSTGAWWVRAWDFPRLQVAAVALIPMVLALAGGTLHGFGGWVWIVLGLSLAAGVWQLAHVAPFTPLWPVEIEQAHAPDAALTRLVIVNLCKENDKTAEALEVLRGLDADVVLLVEFDGKWRDALQPLGDTYPHQLGDVRDEGLGLMLWSRLDLRDAEVRHLVSDRRASVRARVMLKAGHEVNLIGLHPTPPGLRDQTDDDRRDSRVRDAELVLVAREVAERPDAGWVIAGDFNDVAWSHTTRLFKRISGLKDPRVGRGLYNSYDARHKLLRYPVDHIFLSPGYAVAQLARQRVPGSDHFAIITDFVGDGDERAEPEPRGNDAEDAEEIEREGQADAAERGVDAGA